MRLMNRKKRHKNRCRGSDMMDWNSVIGKTKESESNTEVMTMVMPPVIPDIDRVKIDAQIALDEEKQKLLKQMSDGIILPKITKMTEFRTRPKMAPELISGILRQGHKMMISGASKAGKSFFMIELALSVAAGSEFIGFPCKKGKVLYLNLEIDSNSFINRVTDVANALELTPDMYEENFQMMHLRGQSVPLGKMVGALVTEINESSKLDAEPFAMIIIDPIYKVNDGSENDARDVARFCNQLDKIASMTGSSVVYVQHHSKGDQGFKKAADRASGSGVFSRDADAILDLVQLDLDKETKTLIKESFCCDRWTELLDMNLPGWKDSANTSQLKSSGWLADFFKQNFGENQMNRFSKTIEADWFSFEAKTTAWRMESTLREFPSKEPIDLFFSWPLHYLDSDGLLAGAEPESHIQAQFKKETPERKQMKSNALEITLDSLIMTRGFATYNEVADALGISIKTIKNRLKDSEKYEVEINRGAGNISKIKWRNSVDSDSDLGFEMT